MRLTSPAIRHVSTIHDHVYRAELDSVRHCLKKSPDTANYVDKDGRTPLSLASCFNRHDVVDVLMTSLQCDVNKQDVDGNTALHEASDRGYTEVVRKLMDSGRCNVNIQNKVGQTALMKAATYDYIDIVRLILKPGSGNLDVTDVAGQTALHVALREGSATTVEALIRAGCNVSAVDKTGKSALFMAIHSPLVKSLEPAKQIVNAGCDLTIDKMWLLNEEKHNLFYQDDEFYASLRRRLRHNSADHCTSNIQNYPPCTRQQEVGNPTGSRQKSLLQRTTSSPPLSLSPMVKQKIKSSETFSSSSNNFAMDWSSPPGSPVRRRTTSSRSSMSSSRPSLASKSSSFDSDSSASPCFSPPAFAYPTAHIEFHNHTRKDSDFSVKQPVRFRYDHMIGSLGRSGSLMPEDVNRNTSVIMVKNYKRQQSEQMRNDKVETCDKGRKISLPCKPTVQFSKDIQIIDTSKRL